METVAKPTFGTVEYFADLYRRHAKTRDEVRVVAISSIDVAVEFDNHTDAEKVEHVRNALAAVELLRAEMRQRTQ